MSLVRRTGTVTALNAGPPATVQIQIGGDTATDHPADYLDSFDPSVGDAVQVLSDGGYHLVIGRATLGGQRVVAVRTSSVAGVTAVQDLIVPSGTIQVDGTQDVNITWGWDSITGTVAGDRIALGPFASFNGGAFSRIGRSLIKVTASPSAEGGGSAFMVHLAPAAGLWAYKLVGNIDAGTGSFTFNAGTGTVGLASFTAERKG